MKNNYLFILTFLFGMLPNISFGQVNYTQNFDASAAGWTGLSPWATYWYSGGTACGGSGGALRVNIYAFNPSDIFTSPLVGTSVAGVVSLSYDYKVAEWSANTTGQGGDWGSFEVQYAASLSGPWTTAETVNQANHVVSGNCATRTVSFTPSAGDLYVRFNATYGTVGDYYLNFDNIVITESTTPCSGTPAPGNTVASLSSVCSSQNVTLSLANITSGVGVTYQWQSSTDGTTFNDITLATNATLTTSQTANTYYQCVVTCAGNSGTSAPIEVTMQPFQNCYCTPTYTTGTGVGDLISNVTLIGTTLDNNTGFVQGTPSYTYYTGQANYTAELVPSTTYNLSVSTGEWGSQGFSAWIDYNDDGIFTTSTDPLTNERVGFTPGVIGSGFTFGQVNATVAFPLSLSCSPPAGIHRMRVRCAYFVNGVDIDPCANYSYGETEDYDITILAAPACPSSATIVETTVTANSADLVWLAGCSTTNLFNIEYGVSGFTQGSGTVLSNQAVTISNDSIYYSLTGLMDNTTYDVYYQGVCGTNLSAWTLGGAFTTNCGAFSAIGFCESFDASSTSEACWTVIDNNNDALIYSWGSFSIWDLNNTANPYNGNNAAAINTDFNAGNNDDYLISPQLILTGNEVLTFRYAVYDDFEPNDFRVVLSTTGTDPADFTTELMALDQYSNTEYQDTSINLSAYTGNVYIAFHIPPGGLDGWLLFIDEFCIDVCIPTPGVDGSVNICRADSLVNLNTVITPGQNNGTWSFAANPGILSGSTMNISTLAANDYSAQYIVQTGCTSDTTIATVSVYDASSAGNDGTIEVCNLTSFNLLDGLSGIVNLDGTWYDPSNQAINGNTVVSSNLAGLYNYDYITGNGVCPDDTANVLVTVTICDAGLNSTAFDALNIYPNPTTGLIFISNEGASELLSYKILDLNGREILTAENAINGNEITPINLDSYQKGLYFITVYSANSQRMFRIVLQ
jgi:hypothetical protein